MSFDATVLVLVTIISAATPLLYAALGELVAEKLGRAQPRHRGHDAGRRGDRLRGHRDHRQRHASASSTGALAGVLLALAFGVLTLSLLANQVATGLALTIFGIGLSALVGSGFVGIPVDRLPRLQIPGLTEPADDRPAAVRPRRPGLPLGAAPRSASPGSSSAPAPG